MLYNKYNFKIKDFTTESSTRPEITGVLIKPKESVATDSYMLIRVDSVKGDLKDYPQLPDGKSPRKEFEEFILPKKSTEDVLKLFNGGSMSLAILDNAVVVKRKDDSVEIGKTDLETFNSVHSRIVEGNFPQFKQLFQEQGKYVEIEINPNFLKRIATFYSEFCDNKQGEQGLKMRVPVNPNGIIRFKGQRGETGQEAEVLLMPIKSAE